MSALQSTIKTEVSGRFAIKSSHNSLATPPVLTPISEPDEVEELWSTLYNETRIKRTNIIRSLKWTREEGRAPAAIFRDIKRLAQRAAQAQRTLEELCLTIPPNMRIEFPAVRIGWNNGQPFEVSSPLDLKRAFAEWIATARREKNLERVHYLKERQVRTLTELADITAISIQEQRHNGFWDARVERDASKGALRRAIYVICQTRPRSLAECDDLLGFLAWQCSTKNSLVPELCNGLVAALARRVRLFLSENGQ